MKNQKSLALTLFIFVVLAVLTGGILVWQRSSHDVKVLSPNQNEKWEKGNTHKIKWRAPGWDSVNIILYKGKDCSLSSITGKKVCGFGYALSSTPPTAIAVNAPNSGSFSWQIPTFVAAGDDYSIGISNPNNLPYLIQGNFFSIVEKPPSISTPTSTSDETTNWKIFKDEDIGIEFRYPAEILNSYDINEYAGGKDITFYTNQKTSYFTLETFEKTTFKCPQPLIVKYEICGYVTEPWSETCAEICEIVKIAGREGVFKAAIVGQPGSANELACELFTNLHLENQNSSLFGVLKFSVQLEDADERARNICVYKEGAEVLDSETYNQLGDQLLNIFKKENLSERDHQKIEIFWRILSTLKFINATEKTTYIERVGFIAEYIPPQIGDLSKIKIRFNRDIDQTTLNFSNIQFTKIDIKNSGGKWVEKIRNPEKLFKYSYENRILSIELIKREEIFENCEGVCELAVGLYQGIKDLEGNSFPERFYYFNSELQKTDEIQRF